MPRKKLSFNKTRSFGMDEDVYRFCMSGPFRVDGITYYPGRIDAVYNQQPLMSFRNDYEEDEHWDGHGSAHWHRSYSVSEKDWFLYGTISPSTSEKDSLPDAKSI